jgi:hypothetical protein
MDSVALRWKTSRRKPCALAVLQAFGGVIVLCFIDPTTTRR